jgi:hypothetical protein
MIDILLLLALPASGKSEISRYLDSLDTDGLDLFGIGPTVQIDDFPYVHLMRRFSQEAIGLGLDPPFFADDDGTFLESRDWGTLIHLVNGDFESLTDPPVGVASAGRWLADRLAAARSKVGADPYFASLDERDRLTLEAAVEQETRALFEEIVERRREPGQTVVIEFARGMPVGSRYPSPPPLGYRYSLSLLDPAILDSARVLYVQVSPEESRRKNRERTIVGEEGSILNHGVPEAVMMNDYGCDDIAWLMESAGQPDTIEVDNGDRHFQIPAAVFDNRGDLTSFLRAEPTDWSAGHLETLRERLESAFSRLRG